jgi:sorbitol-specific phosphotransferase system component IIC
VASTEQINSQVNAPTDTAASLNTVAGNLNSPTRAFNFTDGWYVFFGVATGILVSGTQIAPIALGLLTVALLYQINLLIEGK